MHFAIFAPVKNATHLSYSGVSHWEFLFQIQFQNPGNCTGCELSRTVRAIAARCSAAVSS
jgi:hypothetical protein